MHEGLDLYQAHKPSVVAVDTETYGLLWTDRAFCATVSWMHKGQPHTFFFNLESDEAKTCKRILEAPQVLVMHNAKFDLQKLIQAGVLYRTGLEGRIHDTQCMQHLLDEYKPKRLKQMARDLLGEETDEETALLAVRRELGCTKDDGYGPIWRNRPDVLVPYALKDAEFTIRLHHLLYPQIEGSDLAPLYQREMNLTLVLLDIEAKGYGVDVPLARELVKKYGTRLFQLKKQITTITGKKVYEESDDEPRKLEEPIRNKKGVVTRTHETKKAAKERAARTTFNPNSNDQIKATFLELGIPLEKTDRATLRRVTHPLAAAIIELREVVKVRSTYLQAVVKENDNGVLHCNFKRDGTHTGRMSSGKDEG